MSRWSNCDSDRGASPVSWCRPSKFQWSAQKSDPLHVTNASRPLLGIGPCPLLLPLTLSKSSRPTQKHPHRPVVDNVRHAAQPRCRPRGHYSSGRSGKVSPPRRSHHIFLSYVCPPRLTRQPLRAKYRPVRLDTSCLEPRPPTARDAPSDANRTRPYSIIANAQQPVFPSSSPSQANTRLPSAPRPAPPPYSPASWA